MTVKEFCERIQVSSSTVYRTMKAEMIPAVKFGVVLEYAEEYI